jgi:hypothetical protein
MRGGLPVPPARPTSRAITRTSTDRPVLAPTSAPASGTPQRLTVVAVFTIGAVGPIRLIRIIRLIGFTRAFVHALPALRNGVVPAVLRLTPAQRIGWGAAPRAGEGAVEVPSARVAVVHDAGRLSSAPVTFLDPAVKVL